MLSSVLCGLYYFARGSDGEVLWWACLCVCLSASISLGPHAVFTNFSVHVAYGRCAVVRSSSSRVTKSQGQFWGVIQSIQKHWQSLLQPRVCWIIQLLITSCSRRDHSVCQGSANRNSENSERRWCGLSARKGVMGVQSMGEVSYLRLPCFGCAQLIHSNEASRQCIFLTGCKTNICVFVYTGWPQTWKDLEYSGNSLNLENSWISQGILCNLQEEL